MDDIAETTDATVTRRTVVRTVGAAAWAAPAIVMVSAAPALAVSGPADVSTVVDSAIASGGAAENKTITVDATLSNANTDATVGLEVSLLVALDLDASWGLTGIDPPTATAPGYVASGPTTPAAGQRLWVFTAAAQLAGNSLKAFAPVVQTNAVLAPTGSVVVTPVVQGSGIATAGSAPIT